MYLFFYAPSVRRHKGGDSVNSYVTKIIKDKLENDQKALQEKVKFLNEESHRLGLSCSYLEKEELVHSHRISIYKDLESMRMGIKELKLLWNTIVEIATANKISE